MSTIAKLKQWSKKVKKRDDHKCKICGSTDNLEAHHVDSYSKFKSKRFEITNGITLCQKCHCALKKNVKGNYVKINNKHNDLKLSGIKFGAWSVSNLKVRVGRSYYFVCICDCGKIGKVSKCSLQDGTSKSCGCLGNKIKSIKGLGNLNPAYKHGYSCKGKWSKEYRCWVGVKVRCTNPNFRAYDLYGGRGIKMCQQWQDSFEIFLKDVGFAPSKKHELDRIDVNGNYEPKNCRWATRKEQMRNTRSNHFLTLNNQTKTVIEWSEILGINDKTIYNRKYKGLTDEECLRPVGGK